MAELSKVEKYLIRLLVILGASKKTVNSVCCLLTEEGQLELTEILIEKYQASEEITEDTIHEMALKVAGII
ncbi:MAG: hypothetical protein IJF75_03620 [Clostridia bacterium]|nr:hypothetical protein [Clostridia bacterium]